MPWAISAARTRHITIQSDLAKAYREVVVSDQLSDITEQMKTAPFHTLPSLQAEAETIRRNAAAAMVRLKAKLSKDEAELSSRQRQPFPLRQIADGWDDAEASVGAWAASMPASMFAFLQGLSMLSAMILAVGAATIWAVGNRQAVGATN